MLNQALNHDAWEHCYLLPVCTCVGSAVSSRYALVLIYRVFERSSNWNLHWHLQEFEMHSNGAASDMSSAG